MRILAAGEPSRSTSGLSPSNLPKLKETVSKPTAVLLLRPDSSGKTTTLHSCWASSTRRTPRSGRRGPGRNYAERAAPGPDQQEGGTRFAAVMKSFLRADPDIIMVGEMRDQGDHRDGHRGLAHRHLVFATPPYEQRTGVDHPAARHGHGSFNFADALLCISARLRQRLAASASSPTRRGTR